MLTDQFLEMMRDERIQRFIFYIGFLLSVRQQIFDVVYNAQKDFCMSKYITSSLFVKTGVQSFRVIML